METFLVIIKMAMIFFTHNFTFKLFHIKNYIEVIIATVFIEIEKPSFKHILIFFRRGTS